jgi:hypothetical protein
MDPKDQIAKAIAEVDPSVTFHRKAVPPVEVAPPKPVPIKVKAHVRRKR